MLFALAHQREPSVRALDRIVDPSGGFLRFSITPQVGIDVQSGVHGASIISTPANKAVIKGGVNIQNQLE